MKITTLLKRKGTRLRKKGQTLVEYALIIAFVSVLAISVLRAVGAGTAQAYDQVNSQLQTAAQGGGVVTPDASDPGPPVPPPMAPAAAPAGPAPI